jgi:small subunit ribosomal protein S2
MQTLQNNKKKDSKKSGNQMSMKTTFVKKQINNLNFIRLPKKVVSFKTKLKTKTKSNFNKKSLFVGNIVNGVISSIGENYLGIIQFSENFKILVSLEPEKEVSLGDRVKIKIIKIYKKFAFAKITEILEKEQRKIPTSVGTSIKVQIIFSKNSVNIGKMVNTDTEKDSNNKSNSYYFIIQNTNCKIGDFLQVVVTRLKLNYGFAKSKVLAKLNSISSLTEKPEYGLQKLNILLPRQVTFVGDLAVLRLNPQIKRNSSFSITDSLTSNFSYNKSILVFLKLEMGAQLGDNVRIKMSKVFQSQSGVLYAFAKVLKINQQNINKVQTNSKLTVSNLKFVDESIQEKKQKLKEIIEQMLKNGMHFGEKAVKSQAKMRNYIWIAKKGKSKNRAFIRKGRHYLNLLKTYRCLKKASLALAKYAAKGRTFLFVGTKKPMASLVSRASLFYKKSFYVNTRWLGGMLTNWKTILKSILKIKPILKEKQKIIQMVLTKRQAIKLRLLKKIRTSIKHIQKGKELLEIIKTNPNLFLKRKQAFSVKRKELIQKGQQLLSKRKLLLNRLKNILQESQQMKEKGLQIVNKYKLILNLLINQKQKLKELKNQALLRKQLQKLKKNEIVLENSSLASANENIKKKTDSTQSDRWKENIFRTLGTIFRTLGLKNTDYELLIRNMKKGTIDNITTYNNIQENINLLVSLLQQLKGAFKNIQQQMTSLTNLRKNVFVELHQIKVKLMSEQKILKLLKNKIKRSAAEKKFLKFLPQFKYHPPSATDATNSVQFLMEKFVDPKIKQAIDSLQIYDEKLKNNSKKIAAARKKKWLQLEKYFGGVANMLKMNKNRISKNVAIIIGQQEEMNAVRECQKLGIQMFHVVDTNCNPTLANHYIPANDNSYNSIKYIFTKLLKHVRLGQKLRLRLWKTTSPQKTTRKNFKRSF